MDALSNVLDIIAMKGGVYFNCYLAGRWGMDIPARPLAEFHIVSKGQCWLRMYDRGEDLLLQTGDIVFFPSFIQHKVDPVESGVRYSLVSWSYGEF